MVKYLGEEGCLEITSLQSRASMECRLWLGCYGGQLLDRLHEGTPAIAEGYFCYEGDSSGKGKAYIEVTELECLQSPFLLMVKRLQSQPVSGWLCP